MNPKLCIYSNYHMGYCLNINNGNAGVNPSATTFIGTKNPINLNHQSSAINIAFKGYTPEAHLRSGIKKVVKLINDPLVKKIGVLFHKGPDNDAMGSGIGFAIAIEQATGKKVDVFVMEPLPLSSEFLDPNHKVKVMKDIFGKKRTNSGRVSAEQIRKKYGDYDLVLVTDTASENLLDAALKESILKHAKMSVIIDHHPETTASRFGNINIIDPAKESAAQLIMQFMRPLGLDTRKINPAISDALTTGLVADSIQLTRARGPQIFKDAGELANTSSISQIMKKVKQLSPQEFKLYAKIMNSVKFNKDGDIAYFVVDQGKIKFPIKKVVVEALEHLSNITGIKYYFSVVKNSPEQGSICSSLRSLDKPIKDVANELGGGGHPYTCAIPTKKSAQEYIRNLIEKLTVLKNS